MLEPALANQKFPHVRAFLRSLGPDHTDETDVVVGLLEEEKEEDLKRFLKNNYGAFDDETVCIPWCFPSLPSMVLTIS
jgi:hypothetical protein